MEQSLRTDEEERHRQVRFRSIEELQAKRLAWEHGYNHLRPLSTRSAQRASHR